MVEGNSTSLESSARFPEHQEPPVLMGHSSHPPTSRLHVDYLGLTPSPGFQLQDKASSENEEHNCSGEHEPPTDKCGSHGDIAQSRGEDQTAAEELEFVQERNIADTSGDFYDPLFDSDIPELDSVLSSLKRPGEELQDVPPEKRQHVEALDETPSLTTASTHESPVSFFDAFDTLFGDPNLNLPLFSNDELPSFEEFSQTPMSEPLTSESTKRRFSLDEQDLLATATRDVLQVRKEPEYVSPYSVSGGPLGYFPSAPGIHVKCVALAEGDKDRQLLSLQEKVQQLTRERDAYKKELQQYTKLHGSGKCPAQSLREENIMIRRVSTQHQRRVEQYKQEAAEWKGKLHDLGVIYNNLLYAIGVEKRIPAIVPIPKGFKPPRMKVPMAGYVDLQSQNCDVVILDTPAESPKPQQPQQPQQVQQHQPPLRPLLPSQPRTQPQTQLPQFCDSGQRLPPIMIDLTEDDQVSPAPPAPSENEQLRRSMLEALRKKKYDWLGKDNAPANYNSGIRRGSVDEEDLARWMEEELSRA